MNFNDFKVALRNALVTQEHYQLESADIIIVNLGFVFLRVYAKANDLEGALWYVRTNYTELLSEDFDNNWQDEECYWRVGNGFLVKGGFRL